MPLGPNQTRSQSEKNFALVPRHGQATPFAKEINKWLEHLEIGLEDGFVRSPRSGVDPIHRTLSVTRRRIAKAALIDPKESTSS